MAKFEPNYVNFVTALNNNQPDRVPMYEHGIAFSTMEEIMGVKFGELFWSKDTDGLRKFFRHYTEFHRLMGYDTVTWELGIAGSMPGCGALGAHMPGVIKNREDFDKYPWGVVEDNYFNTWGNHFRMLREEMPDGMMAVAGPGNGVFECVEDIVGYQNLCLLIADYPDVYEGLFKKVGDVVFGVWKRFLEEFGDVYCGCRFGDDLGFKSSTLLPPDHIRKHLIPQYKRVIDLVHSYGKPFFIHCCGNIFSVMDDLIDVAGIDGKHSNEDVIAPFSVWVEKYGDRICNIGGMDVDVICRGSAEEIKRYTLDVVESTIGHGGVIYGSGNSIPLYMPTKNYVAMVNTVREYRGDF